MRIFSILAGVLALCAPALADAAPKQPETIVIKDLFAEGGLKKVKPDWAEINKHPLGSPGNPVRCELPAGEHRYLSRLRCPGGHSPEYNRDGSDGRSPYTAIMDIYTVICPEADGMEPKRVFMDMYHPDYQERRPVPGFSIVPPIRSEYPKAG